jgi:DNA-binding NarL/FixJ family response regulator
MKRIRLLLLDDHILFRESLSRLLASEPDFEVAAQCGTAADALEVLRHVAVDIVLLDFDLGQDHGNRFLSLVRQSGYTGRTLVVTAASDASEASIALRLGASGIFLKQNSPTSLMKVIRMVTGGELWVDEKVIQLMADGVSRRQDRGLRKLLTEREQQVLEGILEGLTNKKIATRLGVSEGAVKATLQRLFRKTRVRTRSQLVRVAMEGQGRAGRKLNQRQVVTRRL